MTTFLCYSANFRCCKWPNIEKVIDSSGHTVGHELLERGEARLRQPFSRKITKIQKHLFLIENQEENKTKFKTQNNPILIMATSLGPPNLHLINLCKYCVVLMDQIPGAVKVTNSLFFKRLRGCYEISTQLLFYPTTCDQILLEQLPVQHKQYL